MARYWTLTWTTPHPLQDARGKKSNKAHTPFIPSFAKHSKQDKVASTSATTLDGPDGEPIKKRRKRVYDGFTVQRESSRKTAVAFKESVQEKLNETEKRKVSTVTAHTTR